MNAIPLSPLDTDLLVFIDETGNEDLQPVRDPVFGLGGCAVGGADYERVIAAPWRALRQEHLGSAECHLHASELSRLGLDQARFEHLVEAIGSFFREGGFHRVLAIAANTAKLEDWMHKYDQLMAALLSQVGDVVRRNPFTARIVLVVESSQRLDPLHMAFFRSMPSVNVNGIHVPLILGSMQKKAGEPGLEVADFVMHAAQGHVLRRTRKMDGAWRQDYRAVFIDVPEELVSYREVTSITADGTYIRGDGMFHI